MTEDQVIHIVPVGFEVDRALYGLVKIGVQKIYLLYDNKKDPWGEESRKHRDAIKNQLKLFFFDSKNVLEIPFDPTKYESCKTIIAKILKNEKNAKMIYINVSTSTKLCAIASTIEAMEYDNVLLYYVVPEKYNLPPEGKPFSSGVRRMEIFSPRGFQIGDWEKEILQALESNTYSSLGELNRVIIPQDISKANRAKLSYYVRKLQRQGYVNFVPGKRISLTSLGRNRLHPPVDDAKINRSSRKSILLDQDVR